MAARTVITAGLRTVFDVAGAGPALVLIHGVGLRKEVWAPQVDAFSPRRRAIVYDTLGHGESDRPPDNARLDDYLTQLEGLLDALEVERAVVVGHSMGAAIATAFAIEHPARVSALAALCPVYGRTTAARAAALARAATLERDGPSATVDATIARWFGDGVLEPAVRRKAAVLRGWLASADATGYARAYRVFVTSDEVLTGRLGGLHAPALFLTAGNDANSTPAMSERMARETPRGVAAVVPHTRHMVPFLSPEPVNAILGAFLDEHGT